MPMPVSQTCSSSLSPRGAAADQHAAVVGVADGVADQVAQDALQQHRVGVAPRARSPRKRSARPFSKAVGSKCRRSRANSSRIAHRRRVDVDAAGVDAGDVEQLAEQAFQRVDRFVDAVHQRAPPRGRGCAGAAPRRTGPSRAAAGAGRGWRRRRTASWRGWRPRPRGAPRRPRAFSTRSCAASSSVRAFSAIAWSQRAAVACAPMQQRDARTCSARMPASCQCQGWLVSLAMRTIAGTSTSADEGDEQRAAAWPAAAPRPGSRLKTMSISAVLVVGRAQAPEQPHRHAPHRALQQHQHASSCAASAAAWRRRRRGLRAEAQVVRQAHAASSAPAPRRSRPAARRAAPAARSIATISASRSA